MPNVIAAPLRAGVTNYSTASLVGAERTLIDAPGEVPVTLNIRATAISGTWTATLDVYDRHGVSLGSLIPASDPAGTGVKVATLQVEAADTAVFPLALVPDTAQSVSLLIELTAFTETA